MKLTGLSIDCLENILEYLDFGDLLNAATSNKRLNQAADFIFDRNHNEEVTYSHGFCLIWIHFRWIILVFLISNRFYSIFVVFGHVISSITITTSIGPLKCLPRCYQYIMDYINDYCSDTLTVITIRKQHFQYWNVLQKPFTKVEFIHLDECHVNDRHILNILLPKMLKLVYTCKFESEDFSFFVPANHFPNLESLLQQHCIFMTMILKIISIRLHFAVIQ